MTTTSFWKILLSQMLIGFCASPGSSAMIVDDRVTELYVEHTFGYAGGLTRSTDSLTEVSLSGNYQTNLSGSNSGDGPLGDSSWVASFTYSIDQTVEFGVDQLTISGSNGAFAFAGDQGIASIFATNDVKLSFTITEANLYQVIGYVAGNSSLALEIQELNGSFTDIVNVLSGDINQSLNLDAGHYRMIARSITSIDAIAYGGESWLLQAQVLSVPEPSALVCIIVASISLVVPRRKNTKLA